MRHFIPFAVATMAITFGNASQAPASELLATKSGCMSCHVVDKKLVGPSFKQVAEKYKGQAGAEDQIVAKIEKGSNGAWGAIPMPPNNNVKGANARTLAKWILQL